MDNTLMLVIYMAIITWLLWVLASLVRVKGWTMAGLKLAFGNRDQLPDASPIAGRVERTARNTAEAFLLFLAVSTVAHLTSAHSPRIDSGAMVFFYARLIYIPVYIMGIAYLRTAVWGVSIVGLGMMVTALI